MHRPAMNLLVVATALLAIVLVGCSDETDPSPITSLVTPTPTFVLTSTLIPGSTQSQSTPELTPMATSLPIASPELTAKPTTAPTVMLPDPPKEPIAFSELPWESAQLQNRIAQFIIEYGYGHPTGVVSGSISSLFEGLLRGDIDVTMEVWLPAQKLAWNEARSEDQLLDVGQSLVSSWQSAFVIPAYLQERYPDLDSVEDLKDPQFKRLFQTAESGDKARLVSCVINWPCERINAAQIAGYGLEDHVHVVNPTSEAAANADLYAAYERGEPWLGYQWSTNDPALKLELVRLEEPAYSDECWSTTKACAYEDGAILIAVNPDLPLKAPDVVEMLGKWDFDIDAYKAIAKWQGATGITDLTSAANWWLESNSETWSEWVTDDAAANVQAALDHGETAAGWSNVITMPRPEPTPNPTATLTPEPMPADGVCRVGWIVGPGERCTYPGTSEEFSVDSSGRGQFLFFTAGTGIDARNTTINGVTYNFKASKQDDGTWIIEAAGGGATAPPTPTATPTPTQTPSPIPTAPIAPIGVIQFSQELTASQRERITNDVRYTERILADRFGVEQDRYTLYVAEDWSDAYDLLTEHGLSPSFSRERPSGGCPGISNLILVNRSCYKDPSKAGVMVANAAVRRPPGPTPLDDDLWWGLVTYVSHAALGPEREADAVASYISNSRAFSVALAETRNLEIVLDTRPLQYLAIIYLAETFGDQSLFEYFESRASGNNTDNALEHAFDLSLEEFHEGFESYRRIVAPPISSESERILVLGEEALENVDEIRRIVSNVEQWFEEKFAYPAGNAVWRVDSRDPRCGLHASTAIWIGKQCLVTASVYAHEYFHRLQRDWSTPEGEGYGSSRSYPTFMSEGSAEFVAYMYMASVSGNAWSDIRASVVARASRIEIALDDPTLGNHPTQPEYILGALATEWLEARSGKSVADYYHALSQQERRAMERVFQEFWGINSENFYRQFACWRDRGFPIAEAGKECVTP